MPDIKEEFLDIEVRRQLAAYLGELTERARVERSNDRDKLAHEGRWARFWTWWRDYHAGFSALITTLSLLVGGLWAIAQFRAEAREKREQETKQLQVQRNGIIAQYATQLGDPSLRNSAVYALAALVREDALPLFILQLKDSTRKSGKKISPSRKSAPLLEDDAAETDFRQALTQAIVLIGEPAFQPMVQLNREARSEEDWAPHEEATLLLDASQSIILRLLPGILAKKRTSGLDLSGVFLQKAQLDRLELKAVDLSGARFINVNLRGARMSSARLSGGIWENVRLMEANLRAANIEDMDLSEVNLACADMDDIYASRAILRSFPAASLVGAQLMSAQLVDAMASRANLERADLSKADLTGANFDFSLLQHANLFGARLSRTNLDRADLSGANLQSAVLFENWDDQPGPSQYRGSEFFPWTGKGAFVRGAKFTGAKNVSDLQRRYLCRWGALDVPGGCRDTRPESIPAGEYFLPGGFSCGGGAADDD